MSLLTRKKKNTNTVNIVPLIDVLIVLIFFFMMTMHFKDLKALNITPPKIETAGSNKEEFKITLSVDKEGSMTFNDDPVSTETLAVQLKAMQQEVADPSILLIADEDVPLKFITFIMDACRKLDFYKIRLQSR